MRRDWWTPLLGVAFVVVLILSFVVAGEPPDVEDSAPAEIVRHYVDNKDAVMISAALSLIAAALFVFFAAILREALDGGRTIFGNVLFAGAIVLGTGAAIDAMLSVVLAESAEEIEPSAVQAIQAIWDNDWPPLTLGLGLFYLGTGLAIVKTRALPVWLGWIGVALGVLCFTPVGFAAFLAGLVFVPAVSILVALKRRRDVTPAEPPQPVGVTR